MPVSIKKRVFRRLAHWCRVVAGTEPPPLVPAPWPGPRPPDQLSGVGRQAVQELQEQMIQLWRPGGNRRSVVFLHYSYYNFLYLARALRRRGWNAINVMWDPLDHPDRQYLHGADLELYDPNMERLYAKLDYMVEFVRRSVKMVHFGGVGRMSFYPDYMDSTWSREVVPWDFLDLKRGGTKFGYTHSGCLDLVSQTSFYRWSGGICDHCPWQKRPDVCSDVRNISWGHAVQQVCDLICIETDPMLDLKALPKKVYREPLTMALDLDFWTPELQIPEKFRIPREPGEVLILHSMGNFEARKRENDNVKGTGAIIAAVERLRSRGKKVRMIFHDQVHSRDLRFIQAQADIIVDQLRYGRYGATARESMMLGKPTVGRVNPKEEYPGAESQCILETPIVDANVETIEAVLERLADAPHERAMIGERSRMHALKWWSADACAERFEKVYDRVMEGLPPMESAVDPLCKAGA